MPPLVPSCIPTAYHPDGWLSLGQEATLIQTAEDGNSTFSAYQASPNRSWPHALSGGISAALLLQEM